MHIIRRTTVVVATACAAAGALAPSAWAAGPCTDDIAKLGRQLAAMPGLGAAISEPSGGLDVGRNTATAQAGAAPNTPLASHTTLAGGGSPGTVGGVAGTVGSASGSGVANGVASGQIATSSADVRRQSAGKPTMAQQAAQGQSAAGGSAASDKVSEAKMDLQRATDLNAKGDASCMDAVQQAKAAIASQ